MVHGPLERVQSRIDHGMYLEPCSLSSKDDDTDDDQIVLRAWSTRLWNDIVHWCTDAYRTLGGGVWMISNNPAKPLVASMLEILFQHLRHRQPTVLLPVVYPSNFKENWVLFDFKTFMMSPRFGGNASVRFVRLTGLPVPAPPLRAPCTGSFRFSTSELDSILSLHFTVVIVVTVGANYRWWDAGDDVNDDDDDNENMNAIDDDATTVCDHDLSTDLADLPALAADDNSFTGGAATQPVTAPTTTSRAPPFKRNLL